MLHNDHDPQEVARHEYDYEKIADSVRRIGFIHGIGGVGVDVRPGAGWACAKSQDAVTIIVDPEQTIKGYDGSPTNVPPEVTTVFITGHEFGHARDMMDRRGVKDLDARRKEIAFFHNLVDDTVIDTRSRRIPLIDAYADDVYAHQMPPDLSEMPKHAQLMYGMRMRTVLGSIHPTIDPEIQEILRSLDAYDAGGTKVNVYDALTHRDTDIHRRRNISKALILPHYLRLLEDDRKNGRGEGENNDDFQDVYVQYEETVHGHQHEDHDQDESDDSQQDGKGGSGNDDKNDKNDKGDPSKDGDSQGQGSFSEQLANALESIEDAKDAAERAAKQKAQQLQRESQLEEKQKQETVIQRIAGAAQAEMQLNRPDAEAYARSLVKYKQTIRDVADVLIKLAAPADVAASPRYANRMRIQGARLHPQALTNIALQLATREEQAIRQPIERRARRREMDFGGMDIFMLGDRSGSMNSAEKARCAADTGLCLGEAVPLAKTIVSRDAHRFRRPDLRTQFIAFGNGHKELTSLSQELTPQEMGKMYSNLLHPENSGTAIASALRKVRDEHLASPGREAIILILTDGDYHDHDEAKRIVSEMPDSVYVAQINICYKPSKYICQDNVYVDDPFLLPEKVFEVLQSRLRRQD